MTTTEGLPDSIVEYLEVWCDDLLAALEATSRTQVVRSLAVSYEGGPYPPRLVVQRVVEMTLGTIDADDVVGEVLEEDGGADERLRILVEGELEREGVVRQLGLLQPTPETLRALRSAMDSGVLTPTEWRDAAAASVRRHHLPEPIEGPSPLRRVPDDFPESWAAFGARDPGYGPVD